MVITRNIYVGANMDEIMAAKDPSQIPVLAAKAFAAMQATNFPERAAAEPKQTYILESPCVQNLRLTT